MEKLQAYAYYELDELPNARAHADKCLANDYDILVVHGCILFKVIYELVLLLIEK